MQIGVIINPSAGRGQGKRRRAELEARLAAAGVKFVVEETQFRGHATELARRLSQEGCEAIGVAGGDGTICEVVNALAGSETPLALLPLGTGNDFARTLGFGPDLGKAVQALAGGKTQAVDVGVVAGRSFVNVAGCGFDAAVAERINTGFRFLRGTSAYLAAVAQTLIGYRPTSVRVTVDGTTHVGKAMLCAVANARCYGGGMMVAPDAKIDDGLFDVCIIGDVGRAEFLRAFPKVFRGTHTTHPKVTMMRGACVRVESDPPLAVLADGDLVCSSPAVFEMRPGALKVFSL